MKLKDRAITYHPVFFVDFLDFPDFLLPELPENWKSEKPGQNLEKDREIRKIRVLSDLSPSIESVLFCEEICSKLWSRKHVLVGSYDTLHFVVN